VKLIGLTGPAGSGKDTVAAHLCAEHGFVSYAFAGPLKRMLLQIGVDCDNRDTKELPHPVFGVSPRRMAQTLGTEWMRDTICAEGWLKMAAKFIDDIDSPLGRKMYDLYVRGGLPQGVVITDVRFKNEDAFLHDRGGVLWHIEREVAKVESHASESGLPRMPGDLVIPNTGDIATLQRHVTVALEHPEYYTYHPEEDY
jgi:hypothetical protein